MFKLVLASATLLLTTLVVPCAAQSEGSDQHQIDAQQAAVFGLPGRWNILLSGKIVYRDGSEEVLTNVSATMRIRRDVTRRGTDVLSATINGARGIINFITPEPDYVGTHHEDLGSVDVLIFGGGCPDAHTGQTLSCWTRQANPMSIEGFWQILGGELLTQHNVAGAKLYFTGTKASDGIQNFPACPW